MGSARMVLAEIPLAEEIVVKRVVVEGDWDGGRWSVQDVFSSVQARPADIFFWGSDILESEVVQLGLSIPGWTSGDVSVVWRSTSRTISNFTGRAARWIGTSLNVQTGSPYLSCTVSDGHAALLAHVLGYEEGDHRYHGVVYNLHIPDCVEAHVPPLLLGVDLSAVEEVMVRIGVYLDGLPNRGIAFPANGDGGALSPALEEVGRRIWNQALHSSPRWSLEGVGFSVRKCVTDEFQYLWWHREVHILRGSLSLECITRSEIMAMTGFTPGEYLFGAPGGEPGVASSSEVAVSCWFFERGLCIRGLGCRYRHDPSLQEACRLSI